MLIFDRLSWPTHFRWMIFILIVTGVAALCYAVEGVLRGRVPDGTSLAGFAYGVIGGAIITFELLLWYRKRRRDWRAGPVKVWMQAHIWLGLLTVPLLILHSGFRWGGALSTWLAVIFLIVIASGIFGLALQQWLPKKMLRELPAETIYSQIDDVSAQFVEEADKLVATVCGLDTENGQPEKDKTPTQKRDGYMVVGAVRKVGGYYGKVAQTQVAAAPLVESRELKAFHDIHVAPYLKDGKKSKSELRRAEMAKLMFQEIRTKIGEPAHDVIRILESLCDQRRQFDVQRRLHWWLHSWLWIHAPLSAALFVLMVLHVIYAVRFW